ncbi:MAG: glycosyltransferase family 2 protein [Thermodesulfobacteriota bacterium]
MSIIPICSVCVANYNGAKFLEACLDSILAQDFDQPVEIIVHDDCSTDNSRQLIRDKFPQAKLITSNENVGFCISNNRMVAIARGEYVLLLNNDAVLHQDALKTLYDGALKYGKGIFGLAQYDAETGELIDIGSFLDPFFNPIPNLDPNEPNVAMIIGACLWVKKDLWDEIGGFPEWFGSMAEDMYLCCQARLRGYPVMTFAESGFDHWVGSSFGGGKVKENRRLSTSLKRRKLSELNKSYVLQISYPSPLFQIIFPIHIIVLLVEGIIISLIKFNLTIFKEIYLDCLINLFRNQKILRRKRRKTQAGRKVSPGKFIGPFRMLPHKIVMLLKFGIPKIKL